MYLGRSICGCTHAGPSPTARQVLLLQDVHNVEAPFLSVPGEDVLMKDAGELKEDLQQRKEEERHKVALRLEQQHK